MPIKIQNANEAGMALRALTTAQYILDLLDQAEAESQALQSLHWYGDIPDTQDVRDTLAYDIQAHSAELSHWNGNVISQPAPSLPDKNMVDLTLLEKLQNHTGS